MGDEMTHQSDIVELEQLIEMVTVVMESGIKGGGEARRRQRQSFYDNAFSFFAPQGPASRLLEMLKGEK